MAAITLEMLAALKESLPPAPDRVEFRIHPESRNRYPNFFKSFEKENQSPFGGHIIPVIEDLWMPIDAGVLWDKSKLMPTPVRYA